MSESSPAFLRAYVNKQKITQKSVKTVVRFKEDKNFFHFTFECEEPLYEHAVAAQRKKDDSSVWQDSGVELFINPSGDRKVYYQFILNLKNALFDQKLTMHGVRSTGDARWNANARTSVKRTPKGYEAVISIPKKAFPDCNKEGFPVNFGRNRVLSKGVGHAVLYTWSPFVKGFHDLENYGILKRGKEAPEAPGVIMNGDFSAPSKGRYMGGWYGAHKYPAGKSCTLDHEVFFTAPPSLRFDAAVGSKGSIAVTQFMPKLKPSTKYRLTAYIRFKDVKPTGRRGGVAFNFYDTGNKFAPRNLPMGTSQNWVRQSYEFVTPADTGKKLNDKGQKIRSYFRLYLFNASGTVWFDDVKIEELK